MRQRENENEKRKKSDGRKTIYEKTAGERFEKEVRRMIIDQGCQGETGERKESRVDVRGKKKKKAGGKGRRIELGMASSTPQAKSEDMNK